MIQIVREKTEPSKNSTKHNSRCNQKYVNYSLLQHQCGMDVAQVLGEHPLEASFVLSPWLIDNALAKHLK